MQALYVRNDKIIIKVETYAHSTCHRAQRLPSVVVLCVIYSLYTDFLDSTSSQTQTASETNLKLSMPKLLQYKYCNTCSLDDETAKQPPDNFLS